MSPQSGLLAEGVSDMPWPFSWFGLPCVHLCPYDLGNSSYATAPGNSSVWMPPQLSKVQHSSIIGHVQGWEIFLCSPTFRTAYRSLPYTLLRTEPLWWTLSTLASNSPSPSLVRLIQLDTVRGWVRNSSPLLTPLHQNLPSPFWVTEQNLTHMNGLRDRLLWMGRGCFLV